MGGTRLFILVVITLIGGVSWLVLSQLGRKGASQEPSTGKGGLSERKILLALKGWLKKLRPPVSFKQASQQGHNFNSNLIYYNEYQMTPSQILVSAAAAAACLGVVGFIFYKHIIGTLLISSAGMYYPVIRKKDLIHKRKSQLQHQFKQALASISSALGAGKSVETAFQEALTDLRLLYPDPRALIVTELATINRRIENGETIENALKDLSDRSQLEDIQQFTEVFVTCKRTGGNLVHVVRRTASIIQEKLDIQQDIQIMIAQKRFESKILAFAPLIVIAILSFSSPDYMEPMYKGTGYLIMTVSLLILIGCFAITKIIMNIKV